MCSLFPRAIYVDFILIVSSFCFRESVVFAVIAVYKSFIQCLSKSVNVAFSVYFHFSSPGLRPWRAYVVTQALASASVGVRVGVRVSTMFKFSNVCIVF